MTAPQGTGRPVLQPKQAVMSARIVSVTMTVAVIMISVTMFLVTSGVEGPEGLTHLLVGLLVVVAFALLGRRVATMPFVVPALRADDPQPTSTSMVRLRTSTVYAAAVAEMGAILWMAGSFVLQLNLVQTIVPMLVGALGVLWASYPTDDRVRRLVELLERDGVRSAMDEVVA
ncbi:hypothetical protein [Aestuariimicrobium ganziense]|uniref:hypothetical protein n=1 Tax=Aestuariimicrobium ganziense TaxID=2773677 RepID=UPI0019405F8A|nr:hypothetical protein [Aestuariimicrobium ganziense]